MNIKTKILISILILSGILRFFLLDSNPPSLDWDEASLGYNGLSLLKTLKDEYGNFLPLAIRSFNDYKPSFYSYFSVIPILAFGLNEFSIRFTSAFFGVLTVLVTFFLCQEIFSKDPKKDKISLTASFLLAISPWHLQFSHAAFEANVGLFWFVLGLAFLLKSFQREAFFPFASLAFGISIFSYHSTRIVVPIFVLGILLYYHRVFIKKQKKFLIAAGLVALVFVGLILYTFKMGVGQERFKSTSLFYQEDITSTQKIKTALSNYFDHFHPNFLILEGDAIKRHKLPSIAHLYWWELPFLIFGLFLFLKNPNKLKFFVLFWFLVSPLPSAISRGSPSAVRALLFLPTFQIFVALGLIEGFTIFKEKIKKENFLKKSALSLLFLFSCLFIAFNIFYYFHMYYVHTPIEFSQDWQYGYKQLVLKIMPQKDRYQKIIVTSGYDQPYIYFLFFGKYDPKTWVNNGEFYKGFDNFEFRKINWQEDMKLKKTLLVGGPEEIAPTVFFEQIKFLDGTPAFILAPTR